VPEAELTPADDPDRDGAPPSGPGADADALDVLASGDVQIVGRMPWSSNATFLVEACIEGRSSRAIYKPHAGERPLWDFPDGLYRREAAAHELSAALGWDVVPLTIVRHDLPHGVGSLQRFVEADFEQHYFTLLEDEAFHDQLRRMAVFDIVSNNTDRKGGHCLLDAAGHVWGIDNGLSFHAEFKLRTVIWDFAGDAIDEHLLDDLRALLDAGVPPRVAELIGVFERDALLTRARALVREGVLPHDPTGRRYPWPLV
jgi:uncharacterized repeat protein (TIGR03843 family)